MPHRRPSLALVLGVLALLTATAAVAVAAGGSSDAAGGLRATTKPTPKRVLRLGADRRFPAAAIPTVDRARTALRVGSLRLQDVTLKCPSGAATFGTWCMDRGVRGVGTYAAASRACVALRGRLPTAGQLVAAAAKVRISSRADERPSMGIVDPGGRDLRELSSTLVTTATGSAASGSFSNPAPSTLQAVTVYDNGNAGGFAGSVSTGTPERFRCAYRRRT